MDFNKEIDKAFIIQDALWKCYTTSIFLKALVNKDGYFIHVNKAFCKALGYSFKELTTRPFTDFIHPEDLEMTMKVYYELDNGQIPLNNEFSNRYICKDGSIISLKWLIDNMEYRGVSLATAQVI